MVISVSSGGSTACVGVLNKEKHVLSVANLGDSGFLILRNHSVLVKSKEQQHYFNAPYQLAKHNLGASPIPGEDRYVCVLSLIHI